MRIFLCAVRLFSCAISEDLYIVTLVVDAVTGRVSVESAERKLYIHYRGMRVTICVLCLELLSRSRS
jgi:hypothetical protein